MNFKFTFCFAFIAFIFQIPLNVSSQCTMSEFFYESFEYTTPIPGLLSNKVYHTSPQNNQFAEAAYTGTYGMYMNIIDGQTGVIYRNPINNLCLGKSYELSFVYRNATSVLPNPNFKVNIYDAANNLLTTSTLLASNTWQVFTSASFVSPTASIFVELETLIPGGSGNDLGIDDLRLNICNNTQEVNYALCTSTGSVNLFDEINPPLSSTGTWQTPHSLTNGHLGTFTSGVSTPGTFSYYIGSNLACSDSIAIFHVSEIVQPQVSPVNDVTACNTYTLPAINGTNLANQMYYTGPGGTGTSFAVGAVVNSSQTLYAYSGFQGCFDEDQFTITIATNPVITAGPNDTICAGDLSSIIATSTTSGLTYTWNPGNIQSAELNASPASTMFYNVTAVDANGCISNLVSRLVVVRPKPTVNLTVSSDTICYGGNVTLNASSPSTGVNYSWSIGSSTGQQISDSPTTSTSYWVQVTNLQNCSGYDTVNVFVIPELDINLTGNTSVCEGESTTLFVSGNIPLMSFEWQGTTTGTDYSFSPSQSGYVYAVGSFGNCPQATDSIFVTVNANPTVIPALDVTLCKGETTVFVAGASPEASVIHWPTLGGITGTTQTITATESQYISIYAEYLGCYSAVDSFYVNVMQNCGIDIPNVFTPNKDGANDLFHLISADGIDNLNCVIVNRWGNLIQEFNQANFTWDGTDYSGNDVTEGVYFYIVKGSFAGGESFEKQGFVSVER